MSKSKISRLGLENDLYNLFEEGFNDREICRRINKIMKKKGYNEQVSPSLIGRQRKRYDGSVVDSKVGFDWEDIMTDLEYNLSNITSNNGGIQFKRYFHSKMKQVEQELFRLSSSSEVEKARDQTREIILYHSRALDRRCREMLLEPLDEYQKIEFCSKCKAELRRVFTKQKLDEIADECK